ncbi:MAG: PAS domain-containing protein [Planctomycetes bacterium]|nr:PAS domain-containing protein [Planctomycetota bacterium]
MVYAISLHVVALLSGWLVSELRQVRILNEEILHHMVGGVLTVDRSGRVIFMNAQLRSLLGLPGDLARVGDPVSGVLSAPAVAPLRTLLEEPRAAIVDLRLPRPGLTDLDVEATTSLLTDDRGTVRGVIVLVRDVSLQHEIERARRRNERLQALSEMSAGMAHEIRTPLSSIRGSIQELQALPNLSEDDRRLMSIILKESDRLNRIITNFLEYAREQTVTRGRCEVGDLLREVALQLEKDERNPGVKISADLPGNLVCRGEAALLKQVFLNLGVNAVEASREGGEVTIRARPSRRVVPGTDGQEQERPAERSGVSIEFIDQGTGIEPAALGQIYDPFFTTKPHGTGMGLAIASRIVQSHDGALTATSTPGSGSTFTVWLPG